MLNRSRLQLRLDLQKRLFANVHARFSIRIPYSLSLHKSYLMQ